MMDQVDLLFNLMYTVQDYDTFMQVVPTEVRRLKDQVKEYLQKFEKYLCQNQINTPLRAGCNIIDLLDCFMGIDRNIIEEKCANNVCTLKVSIIGCLIKVM